MTIISLANVMQCIAQQQEIPQNLQIIHVDSIPFLITFLTHERCPEGVSVYLLSKKLTVSELQSIAMALGSGSCRRGLRIEFTKCSLGCVALEIIFSRLNKNFSPQDLSLRLLDSLVLQRGAVCNNHCQWHGDRTVAHRFVIRSVS